MSPAEAYFLFVIAPAVIGLFFGAHP